MPMLRNGLAAVFFLTLIACGQDNETAAADDKEEEDETPPVPVETTLPERGDIFATYSGTAPIEAFAEADVIAKVGGEVRDIRVEEGDLVSSGDLLARLDGDRLRLELGESQANLRKLQRDFERNKDLRERDLISEGDFEKIQFDMEALEANYNLAKLEYDYTFIRSPIDGVVSERMIKLGNTVEEGAALFRVTSLDPLVSYLFVPERQYRSLAPGQPVSLSIDALGNDRILASVTRVSPIVDPETGTFKVTIEISDAELRVKPGMFARIAIVYDRREGVLKIPRTALIEDAGGDSVFVVEDSIAKRRFVDIGYSDRGMVEVLSGLEDDDVVVTVGQVGLKEDSTVVVINADDVGVPTVAGESPEESPATLEGE